MTIWFTSDTHFGHKNIITHCARPFASVTEMDATMIQRWNERVQPQDTVWHLGDFCFRGDPQPYLKQLRGKIHLLLGNHDDIHKVVDAGFASVRDVHYLRHEGWRLFLSHYAHRTWRNSHRGTWHLFGHSHGTLPDHGRSTDVGVDAWGFAPVNLAVLGARFLETEVAP